MFRRLQRKPKKFGSVHAQHISRVSLFADIGNLPGVLDHLAEYLSAKSFHAGDTIIREGEPGAELYILISGRAGVYKTTPDGDLYKVAVLDAQSHVFFGEGALLESDARSATIRAETTCECLLLGREAFELFCQENPVAACFVIKRLAKAVLGRLRKSNEDLTLLYNALIAEIRGS